MSATRTFLLEVGCEEIPAGMLPGALVDLRARLLAALGDKEGLGGSAEEPPQFGGPRRLVACITGVRDREDDRVALVSGPPTGAAYDKAGGPTKAAIGFAKAQGVSVEQLEKVRGEKGEVVAVRRRIAGREASAVLAEACPRILSEMRFPKMMRWGDRGHCFVRPIHWIVALLDHEVVEFEFMGVRSGRATSGHRFLSPGPHEVPHASRYEEIVRERGKVIARNADRRERIRQARDRAAAAMGWRAREDEDLLNELTFLNECPGVVTGSFDRAYLDLPAPVIVTAMRHHQKYFPAEGSGGGLAPGFVAVINLPEDPEGLIRRGNEWVLKARLADARFFWTEDRKRKLADRVEDLARLSFHEKLGSYLARTQRLVDLASTLAATIGLDGTAQDRVRIAARLAKCDLLTGMVGEFPELQGIMGGIYAREEGIPIEAARAIEEHYLPISPEGPVPKTPEGAVLALADKLDLMTGCFAAGLIPKGSADPYGLRRAAHGVTRIMLSPALAGSSGRVSLKGAVEKSLALYEAQGIGPAARERVREDLLEFLSQRLRFLMEEGRMRFDTARAILAAGFDDVADAWRRGAALTELRTAASEEDFLALAASAKRIRNILAQARDKGLATDGPIAAGLLRDKEEKDLHGAVGRVREGLERQVAAGDYVSALRSIASLRPQVDRFFDKVLVMAPEEDLRRNRLALLSGLSQLLSRVADFSEIVVEGEASERRA
ncbi:MAG TPA: glycine--tRNA ligase subunit beta [Candidatus Polarisedimenticolia bacterium]|jgi:glycyl-tRNA synthetase beta chain